MRHRILSTLLTLLCGASMLVAANVSSALAQSEVADEKPATPAKADNVADEKSAGETKSPDEAASPNQAATPKNPADPTATLRRLMPDADVWIDSKNKHVVIDGEVCLTRGLLEMFACLKGTKEHESVVSVNTKAYVVHAALLALGAEPGSPAKWEPKYTPARGTQVDIMVYWTDEKGEPHKARAQEWVRGIKTQKALESPWVFAGSGFYFDEMTRQRYYLAEAGDFICVSNFPTAMLDLPIESSQDNQELAFEAFTENIPPRGTKVKLVLMPQLKQKAAAAAKADEPQAK